MRARRYEQQNWSCYWILTYIIDDIALKFFKLNESGKLSGFPRAPDIV
jgi:hypothetical protein